MLLTLVERLRCPRDHVATPLVVVARAKRDLELVEGFAGCPVCRLEVAIKAGDVRFDATDPAPGAAVAVSPSGPAPELERVIALLGLAEPEGAVLLTGRYADLAAPLAAATGVHAVVMYAERVQPASEFSSAVLGAPPRVPFTDGTFRGAALDADTPRSIIEDAVRAVAIQGRVLAHVSVAPTVGVRELARDDREWVASREAVGRVVELKRSRQ